jgi:hypothetical protein
MGKKHQNTTIEDRAHAELQEMKHKDLKRACIVRGLEFEQVVNLTVPALSNWFVQNYENGQNTILLDEYDAWLLGVLKERGIKDGDALLHPSLRLGYHGEFNPETGDIITKRPKGIKKPKKPKRERDEETKLFTGTKKALTYKCQKEGKTLDETYKIVKEQFPEAVEKSMKIWYNRSKKANAK